MISGPPVFLWTIPFFEQWLQAGKRNPGHDQNTGSDLHCNSWLLQGWWESWGGNSLRWNGNGSSAGIMWILSDCQPTKSLWSIPHSTGWCTEAILQQEGCFSRPEKVEVCNGLGGWSVGKSIPSVTRTKGSWNLCCNGISPLRGWNGYWVNTNAMSGVPE